MDYQGMRTYRRFHQEPVPEAVLGEMMENVRLAKGIIMFPSMPLRIL